MSKLRTDDLQTSREIVGYLNFSEGRPDAGFLKGLNAFLKRVSWAKCRSTLTEVLAELSASSPAFHDTQQAEAALKLTFEYVLPAYREHHRDLLFHLGDGDFENPFFLGRVFEAVL